MVVLPISPSYDFGPPIVLLALLELAHLAKLWLETSRMTALYLKLAVRLFPAKTGSSPESHSVGFPLNMGYPLFYTLQSWWGNRISPWDMLKLSHIQWRAVCTEPWRSIILSSFFLNFRTSDLFFTYIRDFLLNFVFIHTNFSHPISSLLSELGPIVWTFFIDIRVCGWYLSKLRSTKVPVCFSRTQHRQKCYILKEQERIQRTMVTSVYSPDNRFFKPSSNRLFYLKHQYYKSLYVL